MIKKKIKKLRSIIRETGILICLFFRWYFPARCRRHDLPGPLLVSLTSFKGRYRILQRTLKSLLTQSVRPDKVILWLSDNDKTSVPPRLLKLQKRGLEISYCADVRSFTKLVPALREYPNADIVIADDDIYYWRDWLAELIEHHTSHPANIIAHQIHRIVLDTRHQPVPYQAWEKRIRDDIDSPLNFGLGGAGVYYPAGSFHPDVVRQDLFLSLCPKGDDIWFYWMARLNNRTYIRSKTGNAVRSWNSNSKNRLFSKNKTANDDQIAAMIKHYGFPGPGILQ
jgi:hypothetical protein